MRTARRRGKLRGGLALIEMLVVVVIVALIAGLVYPASVRGLESIRLSSATTEVAALLNGALERAERKQTAIEITIDKPHNAILLRSAEAGFERALALPSGVFIDMVLPELPSDLTGIRTVMVYPGGTPPRIAIRLASANGAKRLIRIDPITGVPQIERLG